MLEAVLMLSVLSLVEEDGSIIDVGGSSSYVSHSYSTLLELLKGGDSTIVSSPPKSLDCKIFLSCVSQL